GERYQVLHQVSVNSKITVNNSDAEHRHKRRPIGQTPLLTRDESIPFMIQPEQEYVDFKYGQPTIPHKFSQQGPGLAIGDVDGNGLDDFVIGGPAYERAKLFIQEAGGKFHLDSLPVKPSEDIGLCLFDADHDKDLDLYCVSGSSEFGKDVSKYQDRLYKNNGKGKFTLDEKALPKIESSGSCVIHADFDKDGDLDLFVGGRVVPMSYPISPRSYLLRNDGNGNFEDVTNKMSGGLDSVGMVTSALFSDYDKDGWVDLIVAGEWMPITIFRNEQGQFKKATELKTGWWSSLAEGDFDNDGDTDYIAGNLGRNSVFQATENEPVSIYAKDFDNNGSMDPIISRYIQGKEYPVHYRETMTEQIVFLRRLLTGYSHYGKLQMSDIIDFLGPENMMIKRADYFGSSYVQNLGNGNFSLHPLPLTAQISPINSITVCDLNDDRYLDFIAAGNSFSEEPLTGYYDAGIGICALGKGDGTFDIVPPKTSGFCVRSDAKAIGEITVGGKRKWIVTSNQAPLVLFKEVDGPALAGQTNAISTNGSFAQRK
ncbi:MAG: FG-GAP repeat domain-containing protein, partial [Bacteroidota bacterium]